MLLKTEAIRNQRPMAKVIGVNADDLGFVRLLLKSSYNSAGERVFERPIHKIALIKEAVRERLVFASCFLLLS